MANFQLVAILVGSRGRVWLVTPTPATAIYRLYLEAHFTYNQGSGFLSVG
jgi:hypothetical protein